MTTSTAQSKVTSNLHTPTLSLGKLIFQFARTNRATFHEDGLTPESDTDHTVMLGILACACAERIAPKLNRGKIAELVLVHDLVEVYAQDTPTLNKMTAADKQAKKDREHAAFVRLEQEYATTFPWITQTIAEYESLASPEAKFIKVLDRSIPKITHILNHGATIKAQGHSASTIHEIYEAQRPWILEMAKDWPELVDLWEVLVQELYTIIDLE